MDERTGIDAIAKLRESEQQFRLLAENLPALCWISDGEGNLLWGNREWHAMFDGTSAEQGNPSGICHPDDVPILRDLWHRMRTVGEIEAVQLRLRGRDKIYRPYSSKAVPVRDDSGEVVRWCGVQIDLSDQHAHQRRQAVMRAFHDQSRDLNDPDAILEALSRILSDHLGVPHLLYGEIGDAAAPLPDVFHAAGGVHQPDSARRYLLNEAFATVAGLDNWFEPLVVENNAALARDPANAVQRAADLMGTRSAINVPIIKDGKSVAMIAVLDVVPRQWTRDEIELCDELGESAWAAITRARAENALQERERSQTFLIDWSDKVRGETRADAIMATTLEWLGRHLGATRATYAECDDSGVFSVTGEWRDDRVVAIRGNSFRLPQVGAAVDHQWVTGEIVRYDDVAGDPRLEPAAAARYAAAQICAFVSIPLVRGGRMQSALSVQNDASRKWREGEIQLMRDIAERTWVALERAKVQATLEERERNQRFLLGWNDQIRRENSARGILGRTLASLAEHLGAIRTNFAETVPDGQDLIVLQEYSDGQPGIVNQRYSPLDLGERLAESHASGDPVRVDNVENDPRFDEHNLPLFRGGAEAQARLADADYELIISDLRMPGVDGPALHSWISKERPDLIDRVGFATGDTLGAAAARFIEEVRRPVLEKPFMPDAVHQFLQQMDLV